MDFEKWKNNLVSHKHCNAPLCPSMTLGPTHYTAAQISDLTPSFQDEILQHIVAMTYQHESPSIPDWHDVDIEEVQANLGLLILAGVYRSKN